MSKRLGLTIGTIISMCALLILKHLSDTSFSTIVIATLTLYMGNRAYTDTKTKSTNILDKE